MGISRNYTLDEDTYPQFLRGDGEAMDLLSFIRTADPTKVRIGERQRGEDEPNLLDTNVGCTVPLLPVAPVRAESELDASVDRLFEEGGSGDQEEKNDSAAGFQSFGIQIVSEVAEIVAEDVMFHGDSWWAYGCGSHVLNGSRFSCGVSLNAEVRGEVIPTLPFVTSSVSATPEREEGDHTDSLAGAISALLGLCKADPATTAKEKLVESSVFGDGSSSEADHTVSGFSGLTGSDFIVGGIRTIVSPDTDLQKVYVPQWSVTNGSRLDDGRTCREMVDEFVPPKFVASIRGMKHDQLFTEFNVGAARQMSLSAEVRMRDEFNIRDKRRLSSFVEEKNSLLEARDEEIKIVKKSLQDEIKSLKERNTAHEKEKGVLDVRVADLAATVKVREQEAADSDVMVTTVKLQNDRLADQVRELETSSVGLQEKVVVYENCMSQLEKFQDEQMAVLVVFKCLNSLEYLSALGAAINKAIEKGMQDGLAAGITHGQEDEALAERLGLSESQPHVDQLMVPVHHLPDQTVIGSGALSLSLNVSHGRVQRIRENIANNISALRDVFVSFSEPLFAAALEGTGGTSSVPPETTTTLSVTLVSASTIPPISMDDYEVMRADGQEGTGADVDPFPNVDDAELIIS
ncbi:hypothetical protein Tco_1563793 [Tanacetum coccineum]